jgi:gamma-glutamyltranspeptidase/glutathione hydrolase
MPSAIVLVALLFATPATSAKGAVATAHPLASEAGAAVLRAGGNAVDAAVAAAFALSVVEPQSSGIGGGGFAMVYLAKEGAAKKGKVHFLDFREVAPGAATRDMFVRDGKPDSRLSLDGGLAVAVPGAVAGYAALARLFGTLPLSSLTAPAERLARSGFAIGPDYARKARVRLGCLAADPAASRELLSIGPDGQSVAPEPGWRLVRKDLARTLHAIGERGPTAFYSGETARRIAAAVRARGGVLSERDLSRYRLKERAPLEGHYRGRRIVSAPPPSAGGIIVVGLLQTLEGEDPRAGGYRPERFLHVMIEVQKRLYAWRAGAFADPDFAPSVLRAADWLVSPAFAAAMRAEVGERAVPSAEIPLPREGANTTHLSVVDAQGNAVALTTTVNYLFGSCVVVPGTGILLNDEMDDFENGLAEQGLNTPEPGKRPLSSMAPTLVFDAQGRLELAVGSPGGPLIPTTVAQVIQHLVDDGMSLAEAIAAPRIHHQYLPDRVDVEPNGLEAATAQALERRGHRLAPSERAWGNVQAVRVHPRSGLREAVSDPRFEGAPAVP